MLLELLFDLDRTATPDATIGVAAILRERLPRARSQRYDLMRIAYIATLLHVARTGSSLLEGSFEAAAYGPVHHRLDRHLARYAMPRDASRHIAALSPTARECLEETCAHFAHATGGQIVASSQHENGAWAKRYAPGAFAVDRGPVITLDDLREEAQLRFTAAA